MLSRYLKKYIRDSENWDCFCIFTVAQAQELSIACLSYPQLNITSLHEQLSLCYVIHPLLFLV